MNKRLLYFLTMLLFAGQLSAQDGVFTIILSKGNNSLSTKDDFKFVSVGNAVGEDQILNIADNGYMALLHNASGTGLELNKAGEYRVRDLQQAIASRENSVLSKYGKFLMTNLMVQAEKNQNLNVTGAVERGTENIIPVFLPKITDVYGSELLITWKKMDKINDYVITVKNKMDQVIFKKEVVGTRYNLQLDGNTCKNETMLIVNVQAKNLESFSSKDYGIRRMEGLNREQIRQQYSSLLKETDTENTLGKLLIASFFEEHQLTADALSFYDAAVTTSPDPNGFAMLYDSFLARNGLK